jgi:hypothetical protein
MRAASDTIAQLAAAMAKAQSELINPVKSLTAVFEDNRNGGGAICYKYAPLSLHTENRRWTRAARPSMFRHAAL